MVKEYLVNNNLYLENIMDYEKQDLVFKFVSNAVGIASKIENNKRIYVLYLTDEFGGIEFTKDCNSFVEAIEQAKDLYESLRSYNSEMGAGVYVDTDANHPKTLQKLNTKR